jgi:predicted component of type VI protein secretion system
MAMKENFISMAPDEESNAKVTPIDNNKTLMIDQYTSDVDPGDPEFVEDIQNINDAFAHFKPKVEVDFVDEEGGSVNETLHFSELRDFEAQGGKGNLVQNSEFLSGVKKNIDTNAKIRKSIEQNRKLRDILKDAEARGELKEMLTALLAELEGNN